MECKHGFYTCYNLLKEYNFEDVCGSCMDGDSYDDRDNYKFKKMSDKIKYWKTDFKGKMHVPAEANFHPNLFKGTEEEYNEIYDKYLKGKEYEFKVIGIHSFDTWEEYLQKFKYLG